MNFTRLSARKLRRGELFSDRWHNSIAIMLIILAVLGLSIQAKASQLEATVAQEEKPLIGNQSSSCRNSEIPDAPFRAFRRSSNEVVAFASWHSAFPLLGPDLLHLRPGCAPAYQSAHDPNPSHLNDYSWLAATWSVNGSRVMGLSHMEYHANEHPGNCKFKNYLQCWYNALRFVESTDGGATFKLTGPSDLALAIDLRQSEDQGRNRGFFSPSNIVHWQGAYYFYTYTTGSGLQPAGNCLFSNSDVTDPARWRAYDGRGFTIPPFNPYSSAAPYKPCAPVQNLHSPIYSLVFHARTNTWIATLQVRGVRGAEDGFALAYSKDLRVWSNPVVIFRAPSVASRRCNDSYRYFYPVLIDPNSSHSNFSIIGDTVELVYVRMKVVQCHGSMQRELMHRKVTFNDH